MAERRCFNKKIVESDAFLEMPMSARCLYFSLNMEADDDGFVNAPKRIQKMIGASEDDFKLLVAKSFIILFESGVIVIKHWWINNILRRDRYKETEYLEEKGQLSVKDNNAYTMSGNQMATNGIPSDNQWVSQHNITKHNITYIKENNIKENEADATASPPPKVKHKFGKYKNISLTDEEHEKLLAEKNGDKAIEFLSEYREYKGYKAKSDYLAIKKWVFDALKENQQKKDKINGNHKRDYSEREYTQEELDGITTNIAEFDLEEL